MTKLMTFHLKTIPSGYRNLSMRYGFTANYLSIFATNSLSRCTYHQGTVHRDCKSNFWSPYENKLSCILRIGYLKSSYSALRAFSSSPHFYANEGKSKEDHPKLETEKDGSAGSPDKPLSQRQKLTRTFAAYGTTGVVFHTCISLASLGTCYMIVSSGIDMVALLERIGIASKAGMQSTLASGASTFVIAYACHKVFMPVRIFLTVTCTPVIVNRLKRIGLLKDKSSMKT